MKNTLKISAFEPTRSKEALAMFSLQRQPTTRAIYNDGIFVFPPPPPPLPGGPTTDSLEHATIGERQYVLSISLIVSGSLAKISQFKAIAEGVFIDF